MGFTNCLKVCNFMRLTNLVVFGRHVFDCEIIGSYCGYWVLAVGDLFPMFLKSMGTVSQNSEFQCLGFNFTKNFFPF